MTVDLLPPLKDSVTPAIDLHKHYLNQCLQIKNEIYELLSSQHKQAEDRKNKYISDVKEAIIELSPLLKEAEIIKKELSKIIDKYKKELEKEFVKLKEQYEIGSICIDTITKRMDALEGYIKNERFHDIVKSINELEDRFEKEAMKIVQDRMKEKK